MTGLKTTEKRMSVSEVSFEQLTALLKDIKHCSNLLSQACDRSLYQCKKIIDEEKETFKE